MEQKKVGTLAKDQTIATGPFVDEWKAAMKKIVDSKDVEEVEIGSGLSNAMNVFDEGGAVSFFPPPPKRKVLMNKGRLTKGVGKKLEKRPTCVKSFGSRHTQILFRRNV